MKKITIISLVLAVAFSCQAQSFLQKAKSGNVLSMYELANQYYNGIGMLQSYKDAFIWYKKAADRGHLESAYKTGFMYENGYGVKANETSAFNYYLKAASRGNEKAQVKVATMYEKGQGTTKSLARSMVWYRMGAERGDTLCLKKMGDFYFYGDVVQENYPEAMYWYEKAVSSSCVGAMPTLAYILACNKSVKPDYQRTLSLLQIPLQNNDALAQYTYAFMLEEGLGVKQDTVKAEQYYALACKQGLSLAKEREAIKRYEASGDLSGFLDMDISKLTKGDSWLILAKEYQSGENLKKNKKQAQECYLKAAQLGNEQAIEYLSNNTKKTKKK